METVDQAMTVRKVEEKDKTGTLGSRFTYLWKITMLFMGKLTISIDLFNMHVELSEGRMHAVLQDMPCQKSWKLVTTYFIDVSQ